MNTGSYIDLDDLRRVGPPVHESGSGLRLIDWLEKRYLFYSREQWLTEIGRGNVTINQRVMMRPDYQLAVNDQLARIHPISEEPIVDTNLEVLFHQDDIAVVRKPPGLPMHEAGFFRRNTVRWLLPKILGPDWCAVHRLDRETSGVLLCARGRKMREALAGLWTTNDMAKTYLAVVEGIPHEASWTDSTPIVPSTSPHGRAFCATPNDVEAQNAVTTCSVLKNGNRRTLIEAKPLTGRTHQIRVHLAHKGFPIVGDKIYGRDKNIFAAYIKDGNTPAVQKMAGYAHHLLHASHIEFQHPLTKEYIAVNSAAPRFFVDQLHALGVP